MQADGTSAEYRHLAWGLIAEHGESAWTGDYKDTYPGAREVATWFAVMQALEALRSGSLPKEPRTRPPSWLLPLVRRRLAETDVIAGLEFDEIRFMECHAIVALERDTSYVRSWLAHATRVRRFAQIAAVRDDRIRADPDLLPFLWRVFEVQPDELGVTQFEVYAGGGDGGWQAGYVGFVRDGLLDRTRVLNACLTALQGDLRQAPARWYAGLYKALEPTDEESREHQDHLRALLRSQQGTTVALGLAGLTRLNKLGVLDDDACAALTPGVRAAAKGAALGTLRLVRDVARRRPDLHGVLADVAAAGLEHAHADVQSAAVDLLPLLGAGDRAAAADGLAAVVRLRLGIAAPEPVESVSVAMPVDLTPAPETRDVVELTACLLEDTSDPYELELGLAALAALTTPLRLAPLTTRARKVLDGDRVDDRFWNFSAAQVARLVLSAAGQITLPPSKAPPRVEFCLTRFAEVADRLTGRRPPGALLATPTSVDGRLDPAALVDRLAAEPRPQPADLVTALLRLDTEGRAEVLDRVTGDDELALALRHALGAERMPDPEAIRTAVVWVAASRARAPSEEDPVLLAAGLDRAGQGRPVRGRLRVEPDTWFTSQGGRYTVDVEHAVHGPIHHLQPTAASGANEWLMDWTQLVALCTPHDLEPLLTEEVDAAIYGGDAGTNVLRALARHPGPLGHLGTVALAGGLHADRRDVRVQAVDITAAYAASGRLTAPALAEGMRAMLTGAVVTRWAASLADLGQVAGRFAFDALVHFLPAVEPDRKGLYAAVESLLSEAVRTGARVTDPAARAWLESIPGKGKAATASQQVLAL